LWRSMQLLLLQDLMELTISGIKTTNRDWRYIFHFAMISHSCMSATFREKFEKMIWHLMWMVFSACTRCVFTLENLAITFVCNCTYLAGSAEV
jgi:hypothetical protein